MKKNHILSLQAAHFDRLKEDENYIEYFQKFARNNLRTDAEVVKYVFEEVLKISLECKYVRGRAESLLYLGWCAYEHNDYQQAISYQTEAKAIFEQEKIEEGLARVCAGLIPNYMEIGMFEAAIESGSKGIEIAEHLDDYKLLINSCLNCAIAHVELGKYMTAWEHINRIMHMKDYLDLDTKLGCYSVMAELYLKQGNYTKAMDCYEEGMILNREVGNDYYLSEYYCILGKIYYNLGEYKRCQTIFDEGLMCAAEYGRQEVVADSLMFYGKALIEQGQFELAECKILEGIDILEGMNRLTGLVKAYEALCIIYEKQENYKCAYEASKLYGRYKEEIFNITSSMACMTFEGKLLERRAITYKNLCKKINDVSQVGQFLTAHLQLHKIFDTIYKEIDDLIKTDIFAIGLYKEEEDVLSYELAMEYGQKIQLGSIVMNENRSLGAYCFKNKKSIFIRNLNEEKDDYIEKYTVRITTNTEAPQSVMYYPLEVGDKIIGVVSLQSYLPNAYTLEDFDTLKQFIAYVAIAIYNSELFSKVDYLARYDELTGLLNRREILGRAEKMLEESYENKTNFTLMMVDLDYFKAVNDQHGHLIGDDVLRQLGLFLKEYIDKLGFVGRYGGEEFIIIIPNKDESKARICGERLCKAVSQQRWVMNNGLKLHLTISIGVYTLGANMSVIRGVKYADRALYEAKNTGKNKVCQYKV